MSNKKEMIPTEAELEILSILWEKNPASVREINDILSEKRALGYTTTLKMLQIMHKKGFVERDTNQRTHLYKPVIKQKQTQGKLVGELLKRAFKGSAASLVMQVLGNHKASSDELDEIKKLIKQIENEDN
jgi:BlaI family penicillinase repressor